jgi:hypothetical protein
VTVWLWERIPHINDQPIRIIQTFSTVRSFEFQPQSWREKKPRDWQAEEEEEEEQQQQQSNSKLVYGHQN